MKTMDLDALLGTLGTDASEGSGDRAAVTDTLASRCEAAHARPDAARGGAGFDDVLKALARAPSVRPTDMDLVGRKVGRFIVERRLGQGGMGIVYEAHDPVLARKVALKVLRAGQRGGDGTRARLHEEARRVAALHHPHIAAVYDVGEHEGIVFLAMERAGGRSLRARLATPPAFSFAQATGLLRAIASGLACAHEAGIIHRDLKPENVVTADDGTVKIIDFGIATSGASGAQRSGRPAGTRRYMAPEQVEGAPPAPRADVFAFGVLGREVLSATVVARRDRAARAALQKLLGACTAEEPARRPRDGSALLAELETIIAARGVSRPGTITFAAAAMAAALGVFVARTVPQQGPATAAASSSAIAATPAGAASPAVRARASGDARAPGLPGARADADLGDDGPTARANEARVSVVRGPGGEPLLAERAPSSEPAPAAASTGSGAAPVAVTTAMDRRGRLFATVPLDGIPGTRPAPAGTLVPLGTLDGASTTQAEVVSDGHGGSVIRLTVRVQPPSAAGSDKGHTLTPGAVPTTDIAANGRTSGSDPLHMSAQPEGKTGTPPAHPAQPQDDSVDVCASSRPDGVHSVVDGSGTMRLFAHDDEGDEVLIALVLPDGEIAAFGEGAAPCDQDDSESQG